MPKLSKPLTAAFVRNAKPKPDGKPAVYGDGRYGLALKVAWGANERILKSWIQKVTLPDGRRTFVGLGDAYLVTLAEARQLAADNAAASRRGEDVRTRKRTKPAADALTFEQAWRTTYDKARQTWRNPRTGVQWQQRFNDYMATLATKPVADIEHGDIVKALEGIWHAKPTAAKSVPREIFMTLEDCVGNTLEALPTTREAVRRKLGKQAKPATKHHAAVPYEDVPAAVAAIFASAGKTTHKAATLFTIFTAGRQAETRQAAWQEMNFDHATWVQPAERMKANREHRVPLSAPVLKLLGTPDSEGIVFDGFHNQAMANVMHRCNLVDMAGNHATPHGFRSSFTDWGAANGYDAELVELATAHGKQDKVPRRLRARRQAERTPRAHGSLGKLLPQRNQRP